MGKLRSWRMTEDDAGGAESRWRRVVFLVLPDGGTLDVWPVVQGADCHFTALTFPG